MSALRQASLCEAAPARQPSDRRLGHLREAVDHAAHLLPAQGPITVFIHHNTLHAFEDLPFEEALKKGARVFGCQPYMSEDYYREQLRRGRIRLAELREVVDEDLGDETRADLLGLCTRGELRLTMLQYPLRTGPSEELVWYVAEKDALRRIRSEASSVVREHLIAETRRWVMRDVRAGPEPGVNGRTHSHPDARKVLARVFERFDERSIEAWSEGTWEAFTLQALWRVCCDGVAGVPAFTPPREMPLRHRDLLLQATAADADRPVHDVLIRFCAAFLDQGLARWQMPGRDEGFFRAFCALYRESGGQALWMRGLSAELGRLEDGGVQPAESIAESLDDLGVREEEWEEFLSATLLALPGWGGMIQQIETRGDRVVHPVPEGSLVEFLAVRLLLDRWSLAFTARDGLGFVAPLDTLRETLRARLDGPKQLGVEQRAFLVFQLGQVLGWTPESLHRLDQQGWSILLETIESFTRLERRRTFHLAYEKRFYTQTLDAVALHAPRPVPTPKQPAFQAMFCIDEREESLRRHVEELAPDAETFSVAGFYFIAMYYRGAADAHFVPLCPAVMRPRHWVAEQVVDGLEHDHQRRARNRRALGLASHQIHLGSRAFASGALLSAGMGVLATVPLIARTLFPRLTSQIRKRFSSLVSAPPLTRLQLERTDPTPGPNHGQVGFTLDEMTDIAERVLRDIGMTARFARIVLTIGHGSTSMNNPHESAHDCGACGGARGGPNGRAMAQILNDERVREKLGRRGITIPAHTVFVGGMHNTSSEAITFADVDRVPASHQAEFASVRAIIEQAGDRDAHERSRRFASAPLTHGPSAARQHVEGRAEDLAQVRPEWGHATNAISIVGRRAWTRGLFLDRRAFLTSYDPTQDDAEHSILTRILLAIFPVCAGINLEYYFSFVDNTGWGSGTKLPHNITSLVGVMDGAASDLRTGLPWQMVEIHEPVRLLNIIEAKAETMLRILERNAGIARLCRNGWVRLAVIDPDSKRVSVYKDGQFHAYEPKAAVLPKAPSSADWYRGWRDHLEFAVIEPEGEASHA